MRIDLYHRCGGCGRKARVIPGATMKRTPSGEFTVLCLHCEDSRSVKTLVGRVQRRHTEEGEE
jgi:hypothetical protein